MVFADADLDRRREPRPTSVFDNAGQDCCARSRILVQASVYDAFMERLAEAVRGPSWSATPSTSHRDGPP
ncbi:aldehyde dehydrogenase family protein [Nonomuraea rubra]|uniref:aldehyde dehydrogenase family protein n=1 Tax=Nonomuraea rubra TaxID=46180 RepID=UPI0031F0D7E0